MSLPQILGVYIYGTIVNGAKDMRRKSVTAPQVSLPYTDAIRMHKQTYYIC